MEKLESKELRLLEIALENLLEIYDETEMPIGSEIVIEEFKKLRLKLIKINTNYK